MYRYLGLITIFFTLDQVIKSWAKEFLEFKIYGYEIFSLVYFKFQLYLNTNYGISFSFLPNHYQLPIIGITVLLSFVLLIWLNRTNLFSTKLGLSLILGGAIGNITDRVIHGGVIDFISFSYDKYAFPIFNSADIFISLGVLIILFEDIIAKSGKNL